MTCTPGLVTDDACLTHGEPLLCAHRCASGPNACDCESLSDRELRRAPRDHQTPNQPKRKK